MADRHTIRFVNATGELKAEVETHGDETVLALAVRSGVNVAYGCNNGNCGECAAQLTAGEVRQVRPHDFPLSESQKTRGDFLMCSSAAQTDLTVEVNTKGAPAEHSLRATIRKIDRHDDGLAVVSVRPQRSRRLRFIAGQYVRFAFADYEPMECSVASCPCDESQLEFHIFDAPESDLRKWLFEQARPGQKVELFGPLGRFTFSGDYSRPALFVAHTLGFAPVKSLLEHIMAQESDLPVVLCRVADQNRPHYLRNLCRSWEDALEQLTVSYIDDESDAAIADCLSGLSGHNGTMEWNGFDAYISVPDDRRAPWCAALRAAGVPSDRLFCEEVRC